MNPRMTVPSMLRQLPWVARFAVAATGGTVLLLALIWAMTGFGGLGLDTTAAVGASLGIIFTIGLGVALMTLIFYSNRSGMDGMVADAGKPDQPEAVGALDDGPSDDQIR